MLVLLIKRAKDDGQLRGVIPHLADDGLSIIVDDTIIFLEHDLEQAKNMKLLLCVFKQLFGLKINFHKSKKKNCHGEAKDFEDQDIELVECDGGEFKYLGIPKHHKKNSII